jgi:hypothetical protein
MIRGPILKLLSMLTAQNATQAETDRASRALERLWAEQAQQLRNYCTADELVLLSSIVHFYCEHDRVPTLQEFQGLAEDLAPLLRLSTLTAVIEENYKELLR